MCARLCTQLCKMECFANAIGMEDDLEEMRKSSRLELLRKMSCKSCVVELSCCQLCGYNVCKVALGFQQWNVFGEGFKVSQQYGCCTILDASQITPTMTNHPPVSCHPPERSENSKTTLPPRIHMAARRWCKSTNAQNPQHLGMKKS